MKFTKRSEVDEGRRAVAKASKTLLDAETGLAAAVARQKTLTDAGAPDPDLDEGERRVTLATRAVTRAKFSLAELQDRQTVLESDARRALRLELMRAAVSLGEQHEAAARAAAASAVNYLAARYEMEKKGFRIEVGSLPLIPFNVIDQSGSYSGSPLLTSHPLLDAFSHELRRVKSQIAREVS